MENEIEQAEIAPTEIPPIEIAPTSSKRKTFIYFIVIISSSFVVYYAVMSLISPARKISAINTEFGYKVPENSKTAPDLRIFSDSAFIKLNREKSFYQARIVMAETDSICLALNLADSSAILEIDGVAVHNAKITRERISNVFNKADEFAISAMLATPFTVKNEIATIKKEPLMIKMAPKDTSEYKPDILPDTTSSEPVNYMLETENGFRLYVYQNVDEKSDGWLSRFLFDINDRVESIGDIIRKIIVLKIPEYHPYIRIRMDKADAKIIYRALPRNGQFTLFR